MKSETTGMINLYGRDRDGLREALRPFGERAFRAKQVFAQLYRRDALDPSSWTDLSLELREKLSARYRFERPTIERESPAPDGTVKATIALPEGGRVEAVAIPADGRMTFCISSQVGCAFGCKFCMTARLGFTRHLSAGEIVGRGPLLRPGLTYP